MSDYPTVTELATAMDWPVTNWPSHCYEVAIEILLKGLIEGRPEYGIWHGPIHPDSLFAGRPLARHGWIRLPNGEIADPTRWVFENVDPYLFVGPDPDNFYDLGAARLRNDPQASETEVMEFLDAMRPTIEGGQGADIADFDEDLIHRLAHTPPSAYPFFMAEVYDTLADWGKGVLVPIDFQEWSKR